MQPTAQQTEAVESLERELRGTLNNRNYITLTREDASTLSQLIEALIAEINGRP